MKVKIISELQTTLYTRRNLIVYKGEYEMTLGAQDLENYKKEIENRKLPIKIEILPEEGVDNGDKDKGNGKKSTKEGNGTQ